MAADALSRAPVNELDTITTMSLDYDNLAALQENDPVIQAYRTAITGLRFEDIPVPGSNHTLLCNVSQLTLHPIVPELLLRLVFDSPQPSSPGVKSTQQIITQRFVCHGVKKIASWVRSCPACQLAKIHCHTIAPLDQFVLPKRRFDCIMLTLWVCFPSHMATITFSPSSTSSLAGQKPFQWLTSLQSHVLKLSSQGGSPASAF